MRGVKNVRYLTEGEKRIALPVFKLTIPYEKILISDGLGAGSHEFTMPTRIPMTVLFNVSSDDGKYVIHAGDGYFGMDKLQRDKNVLIHELTHVWQGEHWSSSYWFNSLGMQAAWGLAGVLDKMAGYDSGGTKSAYSYDEDDLWDWDDYHAEQQAKIVEHWYRNGMKTNPDQDFRFYYVQTYIWGVKSSPDWLEQYRAKRVPRAEPLPVSTLKEFYIADMDGYFLPVLQRHFARTDRAGPGARVKQLERMFRLLRSEQACELLSRLRANRRADKIAVAFHTNLSSATRKSLLTVLTNRCRGTDV